MSVPDCLSRRICPVVDQDLVVIEETAAAGKYRQRRIGLTERWMRDEVIEPRHYAAATQYAFDFEAAQLRGRYGVMDMERVARSTADNDGAVGRVVDAKRRINKAMAVLGKFAGDAVWAVVGEDMSLREYATRKATSGRPISVNEVKGRVMSGLDILADHYKI